ncbi:hypothetical protein GO003_001685 [Methylicorpusculum oleiharenae]|uniref:hypothetical protein n=1 Tax=Methylicorpusculum oleiharenae TaxID=1338687 RepID=UPI001359369D|nr:hypothetical protein [Methylicorpusculum oleiharenae]MCD2449103.1 hypothetical protein [Methylicorpusculum oleiharenae]
MTPPISVNIALKNTYDFDGLISYSDAAQILHKAVTREVKHFQRTDARIVVALLTRELAKQLVFNEVLVRLVDAFISPFGRLLAALLQLWLIFWVREYDKRLIS